LEVNEYDKEELIELLEYYEDDRSVLICCGSDNRDVLDVSPNIDTDDPVILC
jgi:hypothetical protein